MKALVTLFFILVSAVTLPVHAEQAAASADANVEAEAGFLSRSWASIKGFFGGNANEEQASTQAEIKAQTTGEAAKDESLVDKAADTTKAGVDWTADKAKKGAEWTKETAKDVTKATGKGIQKAGAAIEGLFPNANDTTVDAEAAVDADAEVE